MRMNYSVFSLPASIDLSAKIMTPLSGYLPFLFTSIFQSCTVRIRTGEQVLSPLQHYLFYYISIIYCLTEGNLLRRNVELCMLHHAFHSALTSYININSHLLIIHTYLFLLLSYHICVNIHILYRMGEISGVPARFYQDLYGLNVGMSGITHVAQRAAV